MPAIYYEILFSTFSFILGAVVGSFLNVCIYRMPLNLSVNEPRRSFCPHCKYQIPWYCNLPLLSWLVLRGRCANCSQRIPFRYFFIELLTALAFWAIWKSFPWQMTIPYWILVALLITATFIDFDHFIIPDEITWGGTIAGLLCSTFVPNLMDVSVWWQGFLWSLLGALAGFASLYLVVEAGKFFFGKKRIVLDSETPFEWVRKEQEATLRVGEDSTEWNEIFARESDCLSLKVTEFAINEEKVSKQVQSLDFFYNRVVLATGERALDQIHRITGKVTSLVIPREAMGFGDVKFIACIGAFLGWKAVFFTIFASSVVGSVVGVTTILLRKREASSRIPFGPYLALGAVIWMFRGQQLLDWYLNWLAPASGY